MKRILKIAGLIVAIVLVCIAILFVSVFAGKAPIPDGMRLDGVEVVKDGYVSAYILDLAPGEVALVDSGKDSQGKTVLAALARRGLGPEAVKAILLTHGDSDHVLGAHLFPKATIMALGPDIALAEGRVARGLMRAHPTGIQVGRTLVDGEAVELNGVRIDVFALPGHTPGSAAFLVRGVLFLGDSADVTSDQVLDVAGWFFCSDRATNRRSLRALAAILQPRASEIRAIACSHSGVLSRGVGPLVELAEKLAKRP
jgi:glyoxylase-like metal-dependent hydrolase (beta-lactamase superfamily II)